MAFNYNKAIIGGNIVAAPELKTTPAGVSITSFTVAVNQPKSKDGAEQPPADFISVTAWRTTAEFIARYFNKGDSILIEGRIHTRSWTNNEGRKMFATEITAESAYFVGKRESNISTTPEAQKPQEAPHFAPDAPNFEEVTNIDDDLPF